MGFMLYYETVGTGEEEDQFRVTHPRFETCFRHKAGGVRMSDALHF